MSYRQEKQTKNGHMAVKKYFIFQNWLNRCRSNFTGMSRLMTKTRVNIACKIFYGSEVIGKQDKFILAAVIYGSSKESF